MLNSLNWRKSSYSVPNGACVEVAWRTSSYSIPNSNCVEVAVGPDEAAVRDSKNPAGPTLAFPAPTWQHFLTTVSCG